MRDKIYVAVLVAYLWHETFSALAMHICDEHMTDFNGSLTSICKLFLKDLLLNKQVAAEDVERLFKTKRVVMFACEPDVLRVP